MQKTELKSSILSRNPGSEKNYHSYIALLDSMKEKELPDHVVSEINRYTTALNELNGSDSNMKSQIKKVISFILKLLEKECNLVAKNHFRNLWMVLGMSVFGLPMGVVFGMSLGNLAFLGIGLPIGMAIGIAVGTSKDKEAEKEGRQLDWELK